jgi:hypothetical protein
MKGTKGGVKVRWGVKVEHTTLQNWQGVVGILFLRVRPREPRQSTVAPLNLAARYETRERSAVISF